jgi:predicted short-subunit dehydrogenase-like oxidoreductase (DUF2520 family)
MIEQRGRRESNVLPHPKPSITIVGAGNWASTLAPALRRGGYRIDSILVSERAGAMRRANKLSDEIGAAVKKSLQAAIQSDLVWFCVPDGAIRAAALGLRESVNWRGRIALHSSGALSSDELEDLRERGAAVASVHPLMTFVSGSRPALAGVPFALEGDTKAVRAAKKILQDFGAPAFAIRKADKAAYHAWGMFVSPLFTALLAAGESVAFAAGIPRAAARKRMLPILRQTLENYARLGAPESFSGPIARGDVATLKRHLDVLRKVPGARGIYLALGRSALRDLPSKNRQQLEDLFQDGG